MADAPCPCRCTPLPAHAGSKPWVRVDVDLALARAGRAQRPGEDFFELGIAVDASPDVADNVAQIGLEPAQASVGALELIGMRIALLLDQRQLPTRGRRTWRAWSSIRRCSRLAAHVGVELRSSMRTKRSRARFNSLASVGNITAFACTVVSTTTAPSPSASSPQSAWPPPKGGQFVTHIAALSGNPYDGHTLATVMGAM